MREGKDPWTRRSLDETEVTQSTPTGKGGIDCGESMVDLFIVYHHDLGMEGARRARGCRGGGATGGAASEPGVGAGGGTAAREPRGGPRGGQASGCRARVGGPRAPEAARRAGNGRTRGTRLRTAERAP